MTFSDRQLQNLIGNILRIGVILAAAVVVIGAVLYIVRHGREAPHYGVFNGEPGSLRTLNGIVSDAAAGSARGIIQLGLVLLIATPVARVAFSLFGFVRERDYRYAAISLFVMAVLLFSLFGTPP
jgi:uncharacterized membrane protein